MGDILQLPRPEPTGNTLCCGDEAASRDWTYLGTICALRPSDGPVTEIDLLCGGGHGVVRLPAASVIRLPPKVAETGAA